MADPQRDKTQGDPSTGRAMDDREQSQAFIEAARELGCEENLGRFDDALRRIGAARPKADNAEATEEKDRREEAGERDKAASRKATEGSRGKRRRGGGLEEKDQT
jgi:hypothetical protein